MGGEDVEQSEYNDVGDNERGEKRKNSEKRKFEKSKAVAHKSKRGQTQC